ncbi:MAG TPA: hypothetical protein VF692_12710, partial [Pyrinomonadaceae bacterium]
IVITGFNTDVEYQGVVYHVQTEDKGVETPLILSLVYNRGTILASKRSPYNDLLGGNLDERALAARLQKQHKTICAAVSAGRFEELKRMTAKDSAARHKESPTSAMPKPVTNPIESSAKTSPHHVNSFPANETENFDKGVNQASPVTAKPKTLKLETPEQETKPSFFEKPLNTDKFAEKIDRAKAEINAPAFVKSSASAPSANAKTPTAQLAGFNDEQKAPSIPRPRHELGAQIGINALEKEIVVEAVEIIDDEMILPAEAVAIVSDFGLPPAKIQPLKIEFLTPMALKSGERKTVSLVVCRGNQENGVAAAQIMVKILGSSFRPLIFHAKTDIKGVATVHLQLPHFRAGRAALLVRAMHSGEQVEMRRAILHG